jgi:hypothetical protein
MVMRSRLLRDGHAWLLSFVAEICEYFVLDFGKYIEGCCAIAQEPKWQAPRRVYYAKDHCAESTAFT